MFVSVKLFCLLCSGVSQSVLITQWPNYISSSPSGLAEMHCYQNDTDYDYLYWYRQLGRNGFQLVASMVGTSVTFEEEFKSGFQVRKSKGKQWSLTIPSVQRKDEAVYLCAASPHSTAIDLRSVTKTLTVLTPDFNIKKIL